MTDLPFEQALRSNDDSVLYNIIQRIDSLDNRQEIIENHVSQLTQYFCPSGERINGHLQFDTGQESASIVHPLNINSPNFLSAPRNGSILYI